MEHRKSALIVEDEFILSLLYENFLRKLDFDTEGNAIDGKTAIATARKINPDLILMDITLQGGMDGIQAMQEIRTFSDAPVIYLTANPFERYKERAGKTGYLAFLIKPIEFEDLKSATNNYWETEKLTNQ